jgi:hypothetical protein
MVRCNTGGGAEGRIGWRATGDTISGGASNTSHSVKLTGAAASGLTIICSILKKEAGENEGKPV